MKQLQKFFNRVFVFIVKAKIKSAKNQLENYRQLGLVD
jgi:hypothetical protein